MLIVLVFLLLLRIHFVAEQVLVNKTTAEAKCSRKGGLVKYSSFTENFPEGEEFHELQNGESFWVDGLLQKSSFIEGSHRCSRNFTSRNKSYKTFDTHIMPNNSSLVQKQNHGCKFYGRQSEAVHSCFYNPLTDSDWTTAIQHCIRDSKRSYIFLATYNTSQYRFSFLMLNPRFEMDDKNGSFSPSCTIATKINQHFMLQNADCNRQLQFICASDPRIQQMKDFTGMTPLATHIIIGLVATLVSGTIGFILGGIARSIYDTHKQSRTQRGTTTSGHVVCGRDNDGMQSITDMKASIVHGSLNEPHNEEEYIQLDHGVYTLSNL